MAGTSFAQAPASAPAGSTGLCKDGTYYSSPTKKGACRGHKGVKDWYATDSASSAAPAKAAPIAAASAPAAVLASGPAPAGATGLCKDGTYYSGPIKKGACRGHKGVKDWYAAEAAAPAATATAAPKVAPPTMTAPAAAAMTPAAMSQTAPPANAAPGGGPGMVWVNASSKVYHCSGDKWYGKTKSGAYMSEADAKAKGNHPDHGKACQ